MKPYDNSNSMGEVSKPLLRRLGLVTLMLGVGLATSMPANATPPPANSVIGNQAVANYNDASGAPQTTLSNLVETTVLPVGEFSLTPNATKDIIAGQSAYLPHTLTNNGNTADTFNLTFANDAAGLNTGGDPTSIKVYLDSNADGVPDDLATPLCTVNPSTYATTPSPCTTPSVAGAGSIFNFVVAVQSPTGVSGAPWEKYTLTGTGVTAANYTTVSHNVTDTVNIATGAVFDVTKSINIPGGPKSTAACSDATFAAAGCYKATYTLKYTNNGQAAGTIYIKDIIGASGSPTAGMAYIANKATWSNGSMGTTPDGAIVAATADAGPDGSGSKIYYQATTASGVTTIDAYVTNVPQNVSGTITFDVGILNSALKGTSTTTNTAKFAVTTETQTSTPTTTPNNSSNPASYIVDLNQAFDVVANKGTSAVDEPSDAQSGENLVIKATAVAGETITFDNYVWNTGTGADTFDVTMCTSATAAGNCIANSFPAGTSFQLYKSDGLNPLLDSTGNGTPDTGELAAGASYKVVVKATIPLNACPTPTTCPTGPFVMQKIATSAGDAGKFNKVFDQLTAITPPSVDLKNTAALPTPGTNGEPVSATATTALTAAPGATVFYDLYVNNTSAVADSYQLSYDVLALGATTFTTPATAAAGFVDNSAPAGWSVKFLDGSNIAHGACSTTTTASGTAITSTNLINGVVSGTVSQQHICVSVTSKNTDTSGRRDIYFKVTSATSASFDIKYDSLNLSEATNGLTLTPNRQGQIYPGGTIVYTHKLEKTGSASCAGTTLTANMDTVLLGQGWSALLYKDVNNNGQIDAGDTLLTSANNTTSSGVVPDLTGTIGSATAQYTFLVQVFAPNGAAIGATDLVTLTANATCGTTASTGSVTDLTTVINGQVRLLKVQALDTTCDATNGGTLSYGTALITAKPGQCIRYQITATNEGIAPVTGLKIQDVTPVYTTSDATPAGTCTGGSAPAIVQPADNATGNVTCTWGAAEALAPGAQGIMKFGIKINP